MRLRRLPLVLVLAAAAVAAFSGCSCGSRRIVGPLPPLSAVVLTPVSDTLIVGDARQLVAVAFDTNGVAVTGAAFDWRTDNPAVASVSRTGLVTSIGEGITRVIASAGGLADTSIVAVIVESGWYAQPSATTEDLAGVCFRPDGRSGWAVGAAGTIVHTTTAGASWAVQPGGTAVDLNDVWFVSDSTGFAVGQGGTVVRTRDGGRAWSRLLSVPASENLLGVCFADTAHGWVVGGSGTILKTANAGATWSRLNPTAFQLNSVSFADTTDGWAVGEGGVIVGTHDGGRSWYVVQPAVTGASLRAVRRVSATQAIALGAQGANPFTVATPDSLQWQLGNVGAANDMRGLHMVDDRVGYGVGSNGQGLVLKTENGGTSWSLQLSSSVQPLRDVWFVDRLRGWAVGAAGRIVHTSKGGL